MLGQPISMLLPQVVGFRLDGELPEGATATDLVLTVTEMLREHGVVGKFVEFFGPGLADARRSPTGRRSATCRRSSARPARSSRSTPRRCATSSSPGRPTEHDRAGRGLRARAGPVPRRATPRSRPSPTRSSSTSATSCRASPGPKRPQDRDRADRRASRPSSRRSRSSTPRRPSALGSSTRPIAESFPASDPPAEDHDDERGKPRPAPATRATASPSASASDAVAVTLEDGTDGRARPRPRRDRRDHELHQHLEPVGDARRRPARQEGGRARASTRKPWVKTSLAPGSTVVTDYLEQAGPRPSTSTRSASTSSATAARPASATPGRCRRRSRRRSTRTTWSSASVLSGNRNFEGRINPDVQRELPRLAAARASPTRSPGAMDIDLDQRAARRRTPTASRSTCATSGRRAEEIARRRRGRRPRRTCSRKSYADVFDGRRALERARGPRGRPLRLDADSTYVRQPAVLRGHARRSPQPVERRSRARACSPCSATASPPTTSRRPARSRRTARPAAG